MSHSPTVSAAPKPTTHLFRNIQFIYELELAHWELAALGAEYSINGDLRSFQIESADEARLLRRVAYFERVNGKRTDYAVITSRNRTRSPNQFLRLAT